MKIMVVMKGFRDREGNFTEAGAEELRLRGHETSLATSVEAAQKTVNDGWCPDLIIADNKVDNANLFVKQMRSRFARALIYMVVEHETADAETPERLSLDGFIVGILKVDDILGIAGSEIPPEAAEGDDGTEETGITAEPSAIAADLPLVRRKTRYVGGQISGGEGRGPKSPIKGMAWLAGGKGAQEEAGSRGCHGDTQTVAGRPKGEKAATVAQGQPHRRHLAFSALLGAFALAAGLMYMWAKPATVTERPALASYYGMSLEQATEALEMTGKRFEIIEVRSSEGTDLIISQDPAAGTPLAEVERIQVMFDRKTENTSGPLGEEDVDEADSGGGGGESARLSAPDIASSQAPTAPETAPQPVSSRPQVSVSATPTRGPSSGFIVTLQASAQDPDGGSIVSYAWSCGGSGSRTSCEMVSNVAPATRTVTCMVTDDEGQTASASVTITLD